VKTWSAKENEKAKKPRRENEENEPRRWTLSLYQHSTPSQVAKSARSCRRSDSNQLCWLRSGRPVSFPSKSWSKRSHTFRYPRVNVCSSSLTPISSCYEHAKAVNWDVTKRSMTWNRLTLLVCNWSRFSRFRIRFCRTFTSFSDSRSIETRLLDCCNLKVERSES